MGVMPEEKPKVMLEATVEELARVSETPAVVMPVEVTKVESGGGKMGWVMAVLALLVGAAIGAGAGYMIWGNKKELVTTKPAVMAEPTKAESPTPTVAAEVKRSELKVKILNGSGVNGAAGKAKDLLESLDYKDVATGNAGRDDYVQTEVTAAKGVWEMVKADLGSKYTVASESGTAQLGDFDAVVILGGV